MALHTRWKNWKLRADLRKLEKGYKRAQQEAKRSKKEEIVEEWYNEEGWQFDFIQAQIKENVSRDVIGQAEELYLPTPGRNDKDKWIDPDDLPMAEHWSILTPQAMTELNALIRQEKRARREIWEWWAKLIGVVVAGLTGIIGTIIGLVSVLKKCP